jgi:hypothetical protein
MKSTTFVLASLMASVALAQPHRQHVAKHQKRDIITDTDWVTKTIDITTTLWVDGDATPTPAAAPTFTPDGAGHYHKTSSASSSLPTYIAPPAPNPAAATPVEPTTSSVPAQTPTSAAAPAATSSGGSSGGSIIYAPGATTSADCEVTSPCAGNLTFYDVGVGACGTTNDGDTEDVIALPFGMMGTESNGGGELNPFCGKTVTITKGSVSVKATVVDKCMSCFGDSIDLSEHAFLQFADLSVGVLPATWFFN